MNVDCNINMINTTCTYILKGESIFFFLFGNVFIGDARVVNSQVFIYFNGLYMYVHEDVSLI